MSGCSGYTSSSTAAGISLTLAHRPTPASGAGGSDSCRGGGARSWPGPQARPAGRPACPRTRPWPSCPGGSSPRARGGTRSRGPRRPRRPGARPPAWPPPGACPPGVSASPRPGRPPTRDWSWASWASTAASRLRAAARRRSRGPGLTPVVRVEHGMVAAHDEAGLAHLVAGHRREPGGVAVQLAGDQVVAVVGVEVELAGVGDGARRRAEHRGRAPRCR